MNENHNKENKPKVIGLKGVSSTVKQSFSHGRSKSVVVETKKKKLFLQKRHLNLKRKTKSLARLLLLQRILPRRDFKKEKGYRGFQGSRKRTAEKSEKDRKEVSQIRKK